MTKTATKAKTPYKRPARSKAAVAASQAAKNLGAQVADLGKQAGDVADKAEIQFADSGKIIEIKAAHEQVATQFEPVTLPSLQGYIADAVDADAVTPPPGVPTYVSPDDFDFDFDVLDLQLSLPDTSEEIAQLRADVTDLTLQLKVEQAAHERDVAAMRKDLDAADVLVADLREKFAQADTKVLRLERLADPTAFYQPVVIVGPIKAKGEMEIRVTEDLGKYRTDGCTVIR